MSSLNLPPYVHHQLPDPRLTSVTLHLRQHKFAGQITKRYNNTIVVEQDGMRDYEGGFQTDVFGSSQEVVGSIVNLGRGRPEDDDEDADFINEAAAEGRKEHFLISRNISRNKKDRESSLTSSSAIPDPDGGVSLISSLEGLHKAPKAGPIDSLVVTTKCDATLTAMRALADRIHPWSTIVLLQNGMGVLDLLNEQIFRDPEKRPNFILASTTHGCWRKAPLHTVHASNGSLHFSVVPSPRSGQQGFENHRVLHRDALPPLPPIPSGMFAPRKTIGKGWDRFAPDSETAARSVDAPTDPNTPSDLLSIMSIPDTPSLRTLRATVAALLSLPLDVHWEPVAELQIRMLRKMVTNACINPLTALADCKNGELFGNPAAMDVMWNVCAEAGLILETLVRDHLQGLDLDQERQQSRTASMSNQRRRMPALSTTDLLVSSQDGSSTLNPSLTAKSLFQEVQRVARMTAANWSSMHSDLKSRRGSTEIDFINGYMSALGRGLNINTPANDLLTSLIKLKTNRLTGSGRL